MAEPHVLSTLKTKRAEIEAHIHLAEKRLKQAKHDLAHVNATIRLFEARTEPRQFPAYVRLTTIFKRGEITRYIQAAAEASPDGIDSRQVAARIIADKGWDATDRALAVSIAHSVVTVLGHLYRKGRAEKIGRRQGAVVWEVSRLVIN